MIKYIRSFTASMVALFVLGGLCGCGPISVSTKNVMKAEELCSTNGGVDYIRLSKPFMIVIYSVKCKNKADFELNENGVVL